MGIGGPASNTSVPPLLDPLLPEPLPTTVPPPLIPTAHVELTTGTSLPTGTHWVVPSGPSVQHALDSLPKLPDPLDELPEAVVNSVHPGGQANPHPQTGGGLGGGVTPVGVVSSHWDGSARLQHDSMSGYVVSPVAHARNGFTSHAPHVDADAAPRLESQQMFG
jgi:hypothetical protein